MDMNDCKEIREKLSAFIDGEIASPERSLIEKHLHQCPACQEEEASLRRISGLLDSVREEIPSLTFASKAVHRAAAWERCAYVKEYLIRPAAAYALSVLSLAFNHAAGKRRYPAYRYLRNFDDFPPESLSSIYVTLVEGGN
jgi:anti-sigma factor RsiW